MPPLGAAGTRRESTPLGLGEGGGQWKRRCADFVVVALMEGDCRAAHVEVGPPFKGEKELESRFPSAGEGN